MNLRRLTARQALAALILFSLSLFLGGCDDLSRQLDIRVLRPTATVPLQPGELSVPLQVVQGMGGSVLALVPVTINGEGPFLFALDTGASQTLIDSGLVEELDLPLGGQTGPLTGVTGTTQGRTVRLEDWQMGEVTMPAINGVTLPLPEFYIPRGLRQPQTFRGLLGSDILSRFGSVTIDYERETLILRSRP
jgi:hypothetical protein